MSIHTRFPLTPSQSRPATPRSALAGIRLRLLACAALGLALAAPALAQPGGEFPDNPTETQVPTEFDSGVLVNDTDQPRIVFSRDVRTPLALWSRAYFSSVHLAPGSILRITSLRDGETQELDRFTARLWANASAYFNGDSIRIEVIAAPRSGVNQIALRAIGAEIALALNCDDGPCGACNPDGRVVSNEDWSARWLGGGCTASVYNQNGCWVSAGHCFTTIGTVLAFRVPLSLNDCTPQLPPVADQFPVTMTNADGTACYPDWRVGKLGVNSIGQTHYQRYGIFKPLASAPPPVSATIDIYGFGKSSMPVVNMVQQRTTETISSVGSNYVTYSGGTTTGGTSGSGIVYNNQIIGINTCCAGACSGIGSRIDQPAFITARDQMCPHTVHAPWDKPFCLNDTQVTVPITICNTASFTDSYLLTFAGVAPGPMCAVQGPTTFSVIGSNPVGPLTPGQCITVNVIIQRPVGLTAAWLTSCYDVTVTGQTSGVSITERGSVQDRRDLCTGFIFNGNPVEFAALDLNRTTPITIRMVNTSPVFAVPYEIQAFGPDMEPSGALSLNGEYVGEPVRGVALIPPGTAGEIDVDLTYRWLQPFELSDLVVSSDMNGDGVYEPLASVGIRSIDPATRCRADINRDGLVTSQDFFDFIAAFFSMTPTGDFNHDNFITSQDFFDFLSEFFRGC